jgi:hypothetical protein
MKPIGISFQNLSDTATLSGGSWVTTLPLANLQQTLMSKIARSTNALATSTVINVDLLAVNVNIRLIALVRHNFSTSATYTVKAGTTPGASNVYNSGAAQPVWTPVFLPGDLEFEQDPWWLGYAIDSDIANYPASLWIDCGQNFQARYWTIQITDSGNTAGYVQISRLWMGQLWQSPHSYEYGATTIWEARDVEEQSLGGVLYFDPRPSARVFNFSFGALVHQEAYGIILEIHRIAKNSGQVVVIPDQDDQYFYKRNLLGRLRKMDPLKQITWKIHTAGFEVEEVL